MSNLITWARSEINLSPTAAGISLARSATNILLIPLRDEIALFPTRSDGTGTTYAEHVHYLIDGAIAQFIGGGEVWPV